MKIYRHMLLVRNLSCNFRRTHIRYGWNARISYKWEKINKSILSMQSVPLYPGEQPLKHEPLTWWQCEPPLHFPQDSRHLLPNFPFWHTVWITKNPKSLFVISLVNGQLHIFLNLFDNTMHSFNVVFSVVSSCFPTHVHNLKLFQK